MGLHLLRSSWRGAIKTRVQWISCHFKLLLFKSPGLVTTEWFPFVLHWLLQVPLFFWFAEFFESDTSVIDSNFLVFRLFHEALAFSLGPKLHDTLRFTGAVVDKSWLSNFLDCVLDSHPVCFWVFYPINSHPTIESHFCPFIIFVYKLTMMKRFLILISYFKPFRLGQHFEWFSVLLKVGMLKNFRNFSIFT